MIVLKQKYYSDDDPKSIDTEVTHIYAEHGHFEEKIGRKKFPSGWHIQSSSEKALAKYTEVEDEGIDHTGMIPETLPDICVHILTPEEEEAERLKFLKEQEEHEAQRMKETKEVTTDVQEDTVG